MSPLHLKVQQLLSFWVKSWYFVKFISGSIFHLCGSWKHFSFWFANQFAICVACYRGSILKASCSSLDIFLLLKLSSTKIILNTSYINCNRLPFLRLHSLSKTSKIFDSLQLRQRRPKYQKTSFSLLRYFFGNTKNSNLTQYLS